MLDRTIPIQRYFLAASLAWSAIVVSSLAWGLYGARQQSLALARHEANAYIAKDIALRRWAASHGGVYVAPTPATPPNPYLAHVPDRDVTTTTGKQLTLMNPAYVLRQVQSEFASPSGEKGRITSLKPLNPGNAPDAWERQALERLAQGEPEVMQASNIGDAPYLRIMRPFIVEEGCLKCHGQQGYKVGDLRGGIDVAIPLASFNDAAMRTSIKLASGHVAVWGAGLLLLGFFSRRASTHQKEWVAGEEQILKLNRQLAATLGNLREAVDGTVEAVARIVELRDPSTAGHQRRVAQLASAIGGEMGLPERQVEGLRVTGYLHDIGKVAVPAEILSKPGALTEIEWSFIRTHAGAGYDILKTLEFPWPVALAVWQHHERLDGSGYPEGLKGENIILEARILMVADVVEAMVSHRPYRAALGTEAALQEIGAHKGTRYDAAVVEACLRLFTEKGFRLIS